MKHIQEDPVSKSRNYFWRREEKISATQGRILSYHREYRESEHLVTILRCEIQQLFEMVKVLTLGIVLTSSCSYLADLDANMQEGELLWTKLRA